MEATKDILNKYFYSQNGELSQAGSALVTAAFSALGAGSIKLGAYLFNQCARQRQPVAQANNAEENNHLNNRATSCGQKLIDGLSFIAGKSWGMTTSLANKFKSTVTTPTGSRVAGLVSLSACTLWGLARSIEFRKEQNCEKACDTVECCVGSVIQVATTGTLVTLLSATTLKMLANVIELAKEGQPANNRFSRRISTYDRAVAFAKPIIAGGLISCAVGFFGPNMRGEAFLAIMGYLAYKSGSALFGSNNGNASNSIAERRRPLARIRPPVNIEDDQGAAPRSPIGFARNINSPLVPSESPSTPLPRRNLRFNRPPLSRTASSILP